MLKYIDWMVKWIAHGYVKNEHKYFFLTFSKHRIFLEKYKAISITQSWTI